MGRRPAPLPPPRSDEATTRPDAMPPESAPYLTPEPMIFAVLFLFLFLLIAGTMAAHWLVFGPFEP